MLLINPDNEYPRHIGDLQLAYPDWQKGDALPEGWLEVQAIDNPMPAEDEILYEDDPIEIDGVLSQNWKVRPMTAEEIALRDAPVTARQKLIDLGLTEIEVEALVRGLR